MKLLLDTHIWLWSHLEPERLTRKVARALTSARNELWLSPISVWEFFALAEHGRLRIHAGTTASAWVNDAFSSKPMRDAVLTREVAAAAGSVRLEHQDPADRFIAATARVYDLTLVTADARLLRGKGFRSLANG